MRQLLFFVLFFLKISILSQSNFPIVAFGGVKTGKVSDFQNFKKAGFNISLDVYDSTSSMLQNLDAADKASIKLFIYSDSLMLHPEKVINKIKNHPAFYGTFVADEPPVKDFPMISWRIEGIKEFDKKGKFYVNLFPNYASNDQLDTHSYADYLAKFVKTVPIEFISFDYYPIKNNSIDFSWYKNLEDIRNLAKSLNKPFWGFANSTIFQAYKQPTLAGLKLQQFGNLLYGAKGIQYFTYWTVDKEYRLKNNFQYSIVYEDGTPTPTYDLVKKLNMQIHNLAWIFANGDVKKVYHDGNIIPKGTTKLKNLPNDFSLFNETNQSVLISYLETAQDKFVIVQNKSLTNSISFVYQPIKSIEIVNSQTGVSSYISAKKRTSIILPGDILIFKSIIK